MNLLARPTCCASSRTRVSRAEDTVLHPPPHLWNLTTLAPETYVLILKRHERAMGFLHADQGYSVWVHRSIVGKQPVKATWQICASPASTGPGRPHCHPADGGAPADPVAREPQPPRCVGVLVGAEQQGRDATGQPGWDSQVDRAPRRRRYAGGAGSRVACAGGQNRAPCPPVTPTVRNWRSSR
jgi:hypothetical protein